MSREGLLLATKVLVEFLARHRTALVMLVRVCTCVCVCVWESHVNKTFCSSACHFKMSRIPEICKFMSGDYLIGLVVGTWLQKECGRLLYHVHIGRQNLGVETCQP